MHKMPQQIDMFWACENLNQNMSLELFFGILDFGGSLLSTTSYSPKSEILFSKILIFFIGVICNTIQS